MSNNAYLTRIDQILDAQTKAMGDFTRILLENPPRAMEWADTTFWAAAQIELCNQIKSHFGDVDAGEEITIESLQHVLATLESNLMNAARYVNTHSTSQSTNLMQRNRTAALSEEVDFLRRFIRCAKKA